MEDCEVKFEIICKTQFGEQLIIVGNTPQLGYWNPLKGIVMKTDDDNYPNWYTENPLMLLKGQKFQFKFVKFKQSSNQQEWEEFPNNLNRKYRTRYISVTLKAIWNEFSGREVTNKKYASSNTFSNNEIKVHKFKISGLFVPYEQAGSDSSNCSDLCEEKKIEENIEFNNKNYNNDSDHSARLVKKRLNRPTHNNPLIFQQSQYNPNQGIFNQPYHDNINQHSPAYPHEELELYSPAIHSSNFSAHGKQQNQLGSCHIQGSQHNAQSQQQHASLQIVNNYKQFGTDEQIKNNALLLKQQQKQLQNSQDSDSADKKQNDRVNPNLELHEKNIVNLKLPFKNKKNILKEQEGVNDKIYSSKFTGSNIEENGSNNNNNELDDQNTIQSINSITTKELKPFSSSHFSQHGQSHPQSTFKTYQGNHLNDTTDHNSINDDDKTQKSYFSKKTTLQKVINDHKFDDEDDEDQYAIEATLDALSEEKSAGARSDNLTENMKSNKRLPRKKQPFQDLIAQASIEGGDGRDDQSLGDSQSKKLRNKRNKQKELDGDEIDGDSEAEDEDGYFDEKDIKIKSNLAVAKENEGASEYSFNSSSQKINYNLKIASMGKVSDTVNSLSNKTDDGIQTNVHSETSLQSKYIRKQRRSPTQQEILFAEKLFQSSGHTLQTLFQERMKKISEKNIINQKYSFITSENDIVFEASEEFLVNMSEKDELCLATFFLPIIVTYDAASDTLKDEIQESSLYYHFINSYPSLRWVGVLPNYSQIPSHLQERITNTLISKYRFYPIFIENQMLDSFLNNFCFNMYDNIMTNQFDLQHFRYIEYNSKMVEEVKMISFRFAQQISKMIDDDTNIMIADYRIIFAIIYLSQCKAKKLSIAYFHDSQFPDIDKLQILPFGEKLINAILCANLVSFMNFESAQNFLKYIRIKLKLPYESIRGNLRLIYMGNQIIIHIRNPGVNVKAIANIRSSQYFDDYHHHIKQKQINPDNKILILSVDTLHENNKIELKFKLFERLLHNHPYLKMQLIQIILPEQKSYSKLGFYSNIELQKNINKIANDIQKNFKSRNPLLVLYQNMSLKERIEYMRIADIFLKTSILQENEIYPLEFILANQKHGFCLINKFGSSNYKQMRSCIPFNPSSYYEFEKNILEIDQLSQSLKEKVLNKDVDILSQFNTGVWIEKHIAELKKNARFMSQANMTGFNKGINFKKVAHQANFRQLNIKEASELYRKSVRRLIIFGYVGTLVPLDKYMYIQAEEHQVRRHHQKPSEKIIENLKKLCQDKKNMVYIVTEMSIDFMDEWFSDVKGLGLICENGYFHKVIQEGGKPNSEWVRLIDIDMSWKEPVYRIMESYAVRTQGSSVEMKESSVLWKYNKVSIDFGSRQAEQMIQQLSQNISQLKYLEISHSNESVEVRPTNLNKGIVAELLIERKIIECGKIDFILMLGSSMTDEDMFCACQMFYRNHNKEFQDKFKPLYVTIGIKPSNAYYYIAFEEVEKVMELLVLSESFASFV